MKQIWQRTHYLNLAKFLFTTGSYLLAWALFWACVHPHRAWILTAAEFSGYLIVVYFAAGRWPLLREDRAADDLEARRRRA